MLLSFAEPYGVSTVVLLFLAGLAGGTVDSIAGGGGLITLPALLTAGLPPQVAFGTNKLQSAIGTSLAVTRYARAGLIPHRDVWVAVIASLVAAVGGSIAVSFVSPEMLRRIVPFALGAAAVYTLCQPRLGDEARAPRWRVGLFALIMGVALGFYDGLFGPGTGAFWMLACVSLRGLDLRQAAGYTKAANLASNVGSLAAFLAVGSVAWFPGLIMAMGTLLGARIGSGLVITKGAALIRPVFLGVVFALIARLGWQAWQLGAGR